MSNLFEAGLSRRSFMRTLGAASVAATSFPAFAAVQGGMSTQRSRSSATSRDTSGLLDGMSDDFVFISMNENPLGPTPSALEAISTAASMSNRYHSDIVQRTVRHGTGPLRSEARIRRSISGIGRSAEPGAGIEHWAG